MSKRARLRLARIPTPLTPNRLTGGRACVAIALTALIVAPGCGSESLDSPTDVTAGAASLTQGDGFTVAVPNGFVGGVTIEKVRAEVAADYGQQSADVVAEQFDDPSFRLMFWNQEEQHITVTIMFSEYDGSASLDKWAAKYVLDTSHSGGKVLAQDRIQIGSHPAVRVAIEDPLGEPGPLRTDGYLLVNAGELWLLEYSAPSDRFDEFEAMYRQSVSSFKLT